MTQRERHCTRALAPKQSGSPPRKDKALLLLQKGFVLTLDAGFARLALQQNPQHAAQRLGSAPQQLVANSEGTQIL